jgi:hypothetical protein
MASYERSERGKTRAVEGLRHRFRPTYAGANMGHPSGTLKFVVSHILVGGRDKLLCIFANQLATFAEDRFIVKPAPVFGGLSDESR